MIENIAKTVLVRFDDQYLRKHCMRRARYCSTIQVEMIEIKVPVNPCKTFSPFTNGKQFLLALAQALTVHKVQGLSLEREVTSFDLHRQFFFTNGQMCVAYNRVTRFENLFYTENFKLNAIRTDERAKEGYKLMRESYKLHT